MALAFSLYRGRDACHQQRIFALQAPARIQTGEERIDTSFCAAGLRNRNADPTDRAFIFSAQAQGAAAVSQRLARNDRGIEKRGKNRVSLIRAKDKGSLPLFKQEFRGQQRLLKRIIAAAYRDIGTGRPQ